MTGMDVASLANWATVGATIVAAIGVLVAIVTLIVTLRSQTRLARFAATSDNIWRFDDQWHTDEFRALRLAAVAALKDGKQVPEAIDVWNFFEMLGLMSHKKAVDVEVVANKFASRVIDYWYLSEALIRMRRNHYQDPSLWVEFEWLKNSVEWLQTKGKHPRLSLLPRVLLAPFIHPMPPTQETLDRFVVNEQELQLSTGAGASNPKMT